MKPATLTIIVDETKDDVTVTLIGDLDMNVSGKLLIAMKRIEQHLIDLSKENSAEFHVKSEQP